jgi:hypothetical protein
MKQLQTRTVKADDATGQLKETQEWLDTHVLTDLSNRVIPEKSVIKDVDPVTTDGPWYILYWLDQYHYLHPRIKERIQQTNPKPDYFKDFSDSIACLLGIEFIKDNSVIPVSDIANNISGYTYNRVLDFIQTRHSKELHHELSVKTSNIFKFNMLSIKDDDLIPDKLSTDSHGKNLITDSAHYTRMAAIISDLEALIASKIGDLYRVLKFIQDNVDHVEFIKWRGQFATEYSYRHVDINGNLISNRDNSIDIGRLDGQNLPVN